jgi:hypothetical protein
MFNVVDHLIHFSRSEERRPQGGVLLKKHKADLGLLAEIFLIIHNCAQHEAFWLFTGYMGTKAYCCLRRKGRGHGRDFKLDGKMSKRIWYPYTI